MTEKPASSARNVVFVLVDDLRYDAMGFLRPALDTPNIDRLARGGAYFQNAFVTSSLCSPSRATMLTGLSMRNHGIIDNNKASEETSSTSRSTCRTPATRPASSASGISARRRMHRARASIAG